MLNAVASLLLTLTGIAYPVIWLWCNAPEWLLRLPWIMAVLWAIKAVAQQGGKRYFALCMAAILAVVAFTRSVETMLWYPVIINGLMLFLFGASLWSEQTLVERLARLQTPDLPPAGVRYTRRVTQLWCGVFILNLAITCGAILLGNYDFWALYTGVISYVILGVVMSLEWLIRQKVQKQYE